MKTILLLLIAAVYLVSGGEIKCYKCASPPVVGCGENFNKNGDGVEQVVSKTNESCIKHVFTYNNEIQIVRSSSVVLSEKARGSVNGQLYTCNTNLCNGTTSIAGAVSSIMMLAVLLAWKNC